VLIENNVEICEDCSHEKYVLNPQSRIYTPALKRIPQVSKRKETENVKKEK
jgi:hypothetical protein